MSLTMIVIWTVRHYINTSFDWYLLIGGLLALSIMAKDSEFVETINIISTSMQWRKKYKGWWPKPKPKKIWNTMWDKTK